MTDFLTVYETHLDEINNSLIEAVQHLSVSGNAQWPTREQLREQLRVSHDLVRLAILEGDWGPLLKRRNRQGRTYARLGIPFQTWLWLGTQFQSLLTPHLVQAFASLPERLTGALASMNLYLLLGVSEMAKAYLDALQPPESASVRATEFSSNPKSN